MKQIQGLFSPTPTKLSSKIYGLLLILRTPTPSLSWTYLVNNSSIPKPFSSQPLLNQNTLLTPVDYKYYLTRNSPTLRIWTSSSSFFFLSLLSWMKHQEYFFSPFHTFNESRTWQHFEVCNNYYRNRSWSLRFSESSLWFVYKKPLMFVYICVIFLGSRKYLNAEREELQRFY